MPLPLACLGLGPEPAKTLGPGPTTLWTLGLQRLRPKVPVGVQVPRCQ